LGPTRDRRARATGRLQTALLHDGGRRIDARLHRDRPLEAEPAQWSASTLVLDVRVP
jgi:hypothetical protein